MKDEGSMPVDRGRGRAFFQRIFSASDLLTLLFTIYCWLFTIFCAAFCLLSP
jgi:hypothetical protein